MKVAIVLGTSRHDGNTRRLVNELSALNNAKIFDLTQYNISFYDYEHNNRCDDFVSLIGQLTNYDHIVFATPLYWYCMSAQLKVFFDRLSDLLTIEKDLGRQLKGKSSSMLATGHDAQYPDCFVEPIEMTMKYLNVSFKGCCYLSTKSDRRLNTQTMAQQAAQLIKRSCL